MQWYEIIQGVVGVILSVGLCALGIGYAYGRFREGYSSIDKQVDEKRKQLEEIYKEQLKIQEARFLQLENEHKTNLRLISRLEGVVEEQNKQRKWFEGIFISALESYFEKNPGLAKELQGKIDRAVAVNK